MNTVHQQIVNCCDGCRQLWQRSWQAVLCHTPLQELAAARAASRTAGGEPGQFEEAVRGSALFVAIYRAAQALADAGQVQVSGGPSTRLLLASKFNELQ
jgi:hypothetical protein